RAAAALGLSALGPPRKVDSVLAFQCPHRHGDYEEKQYSQRSRAPVPPELSRGSAKPFWFRQSPSVASSAYLTYDLGPATSILPHRSAGGRAAISSNIASVRCIRDRSALLRCPSAFDRPGSSMLPSRAQFRACGRSKTAVSQRSWWSICDAARD